MRDTVRQMPSSALWFSDHGLAVGQRNLAQLGGPLGPRESVRLEALLAVAFGRRLSPELFQHVVEAAAVSLRGDQALANLRLAVSGLSYVRTSQGLPERLATAEKLLASGMTPEALLEALDPLQDPAGTLAKYDPDQPRVPAGSGPESGRWTTGSSVAGAGAAALAVSARVAPMLVPDLGALAAAALSGLAGSLGFATTLGLLFVPSPNDVSTSGPLPGESGASYDYNRDEGLLRVRDPAGEVLVAGHKDKSGVFYDAATGVPFAREVDGALVLDEAATREHADTAPIAGAEADTNENQPKLCPDPGPDQAGSGSASPRAKAYQEQISRMINPQRPLPYGLAMNLVDPKTSKIVHFDECDESDGTMIDAKGPAYERVIGFDPGRDNVTREWLRQSEHQVSAAGPRQIKWYFAEEGAARYARWLFADRDRGRETIIIKVQPADLL